MKSLFNTLILLIFFGCANDNQKNSKMLQSINHSESIDIYREAQREFNRSNLKQALKLFKQYVKINGKSKDKEIRRRVFWSIDQISRIYLRSFKNPRLAATYLNRLLKEEYNLNDSEEDDINEWLSVAIDWQKLGRMPKNIRNAEELFILGEKYFRSGMEKLQFPADNSGNADFHIAATYLVPYVYNYQKAKNTGKALFMLGNIRYRSWNDLDYWTENFYLKEVIRRNPHSLLSKKAYNVLEMGIKSGYTGTAGESVPPSQIEMLKILKRLAMPITKKK